MNNFLTPQEIVEMLIESGIKKSSLSYSKRLVMSIMAGMYIALGSHAFIVAYSNQFIRAAVFPVGLMLIVIVGGELFTGNCLMTFSLLRKKITISRYVQTLLQVFIGNFIGSIIIAALLIVSGYYSSDILKETINVIIEGKLNLSFIQAFTRGILCNMLVVMGVWFSSSAKDTIGKIFGCWFPVMLFVLSGYEHVVANMFFFPIGCYLDSSINIIEVLLRNILPVALGNFIGGGIIVPFVYNLVHK